MERPGPPRLIPLHTYASTLHEARQKATGSDYALARPYHLTRHTIRRWRKRANTRGDNHTALRLQPAILDTAPKERGLYLRTQLQRPLNDLLAVIKKFIEPAMSSPALDRLLRCRSHPRQPIPEKATRTPSHATAICT